MKIDLYKKIILSALLMLLALTSVSGCGSGSDVDSILQQYATPTPQAGNVTGKSVDINDLPLSGAFVAFYSYDYPTSSEEYLPDKTTVTDGAGDFTFNNVPEGDFRLELWKSESDYNTNPGIIAGGLNGTLIAPSENVTMKEGNVELTKPLWDWEDVATWEDILDIYFVDRLNGWAGATGGTILRSKDGGNTWHETPVPSFEDIRALQFINANEGWAVGSEGTIFHTVNGGESWGYSYLSTIPLNDIFFTDRLHGWAGGVDGDIYVTSDGGETWDYSFLWTEDTINALYFIDNEKGWAAGSDGNILYTLDGGYTWDIQLLWDVSIIDIFFRGSSGWAVDKDGFIFHTENLGEDWENQDYSINSLNKIYFTDENTGWAAGEDGTVVYTEDGGENWYYQDSDTVYNLYCLHFLDKNTGWAAGETGGLIVYRQYLSMYFLK